MRQQPDCKSVSPHPTPKLLLLMPCNKLRVRTPDHQRVMSGEAWASSRRDHIPGWWYAHPSAVLVSEGHVENAAAILSPLRHAPHPCEKKAGTAEPEKVKRKTWELAS